MVLFEACFLYSPTQSIDFIYLKLGSIVVHFCVSKFMGNCIHKVDYDAVKNTVAVYRVYKTYLSFPFSRLLFTVWAKIKFTFRFRTTVILRYEMSRFYGFLFFRSYANWLRTQRIISLTSKLSTQNIKHVQESRKTFQKYVGSKCYKCWAGLGDDRSIANCISGSRKAVDIGQ